MVLEIPISPRAREYGYVIWPKALDDAVERLLHERVAVDVEFQESYLGEKRVDWKHRRISVGYKQTRALPGPLTTYRLSFRKNGRLRIVCS